MNTGAVVDRVRSRLAVQPGPPTRAGVAALVREEAGGLLGDPAVPAAARAATDALPRARVPEPLLRAAGVTRGPVNGPDGRRVERGIGPDPARPRVAE